MENKKMPSNNEGKQLNTQGNHTTPRLSKQQLSKAIARAESAFSRYSVAYEFLRDRRDHQKGLVKSYLDLIHAYEDRIVQHTAQAKSFDYQASEYLPLMRLAWSEKLQLEEHRGYSNAGG